MLTTGLATQLLRSALGASWASRGALPTIACMHTASAALMPDVSVPPLGESVSEGSISTILKKQGDTVNVDDVVAQLETDKVTIDCRSPHAGTISQLLVKVGDIVTPGTVLCVVGEGDPAPATPAPAAPASTPASQPAASPAAAAQPATSHRTPMIHFPPRVLPDGRRISDLPAAEADAALAALASPPTTSHTQQPTQTPAAPQPPPPPPPAASPRAAAPTVRAAFGDLETDAGFGQPKERRSLTQREMDMINSGGAF